MSPIWVIILSLIGIILLLVEFFLIPGISIAGIGGFLSIIISVIFAFKIKIWFGYLLTGFDGLILFLLLYCFITNYFVTASNIITLF